MKGQPASFGIRHMPEWLLIAYIVLFAIAKHTDNPWDRMISSDGKGYYAYLPAVFIYHDLNFGFIPQYEKD